MCPDKELSGQPGKARAIRGSEPPRCAPHSGLVGAPQGNSNAVTHGYYRRRVDLAEIDALHGRAGEIDITQEIILLRILTHQLASAERERFALEGPSEHEQNA